MRLTFSVHGDSVVSAIEVGTLSYKQELAYQPLRVADAAREVVEILARGNRAHTLSDNNLRNLRGVGEELAALLVPREVADRLRSIDRSLYLQVDEQLVPVPWELLHDGETFWCRRFDLGRAVATPQAIVGAIAPIPTVGPLRMLLICSNPRNDLPEVESEAQKIVRRLDGTDTLDVHLLVDPSVETVRRQLKEHELVHFAGHADHDPDHPEHSGWYLADGKLTAADVRAMAGGRRMPLLVFSNACRSSQTSAWQASESPSQVYGLANAFLLGGVRLYLGTQWEVVDGQSADYAVAFYEALSRSATAGAAARVARNEILRAAGESALAWASYVLYGDPMTRPVRPRESTRTQPPMLSAGQLEMRVSAPWKRAGKRYSSPGASRSLPMIEPVKPKTNWLVLAIGLLSLIVGVSLALTFSLRSSSTKDQTVAAGVDAKLGSLEEGRDAELFPLVALIDEDSCVRDSIRQSKRFRLVPPERIEQAVQAEPDKGPRELGRTLDAEVVISRDKAKKAFVAVDVLTGDEICHAGCEKLAKNLVRILHGEGVVTEAGQGVVTVNLGWRSRVAPGARLEVKRDGKWRPLLQVTRVELDSCTAAGQASTGEPVRLGTGSTPSKRQN